MRTTLRKLSIAAIAATLLAGSALAGDSWLTSYKDALAKSKETKLPVMADFTGSDWCHWCISLKKEVFDTDEFKKWAADHVILLELDFPQGKKLSKELTKQNEDLKAKFNIEGFPTLVFLNGDGKELGRGGYVEGGPKPWIEAAEKAMKGEPKDAAKAPEAKAGEDKGPWIESWDDAVKRSKKEGKMILADFTGSDWCPWCIKLHDEVFNTPEFKSWASANVVLLLLDFPHHEQADSIKKQNEKLQSKYGIQGFPTVLFLDAAGKKKGQMGYEAGGPKPWIEKAAKIAGNKKPAPAPKDAPAKDSKDGEKTDPKAGGTDQKPTKN